MHASLHRDRTQLRGTCGRARGLLFIRVFQEQGSVHIMTHFQIASSVLEVINTKSRGINGAAMVVNARGPSRVFSSHGGVDAYRVT